MSSALLLLTHLPGRSQVSPLPRPLPQPQVLARLAWLPAPPWCPQGGSEVTPHPNAFNSAFPGHRKRRKKQEERGGHLKVGSRGSGLPQKIGGPGYLLQFK